MILDITKIPVIYINLDDRKDRKHNMESMLKKYGFSNYQRFSGVKAGNRVGCSMSHSAVLEKIIEENLYPCLVLEDDLEIYKRFRKEISVPDDADAMYLGISRYGFNADKDDPFPRSLKISELGEEYHRMHNMLARHAVIHFSKEYDKELISGMNKFISNPTKYIAGDATLSTIHPNFKVYTQNIPIFYQNADGVRGLTMNSIYDCNYLEVDKL